MSMSTLTVLIVAALIGGYTDWRARRIPNWLTAAVVAYGLAWHAHRAGWSGFLFSLGGLALGAGLILLPMLIPWAKRGLGAGDVKFLAAVGSVVGAQGVFMVFALATAIGAVMGTIALNRASNSVSEAMGQEGRRSRAFSVSAPGEPAGSGRSQVSGSSPVSSSAPIWLPCSAARVSIPYGVALSAATLLLVALVIGGGQ